MLHADYVDDDAGSFRVAVDSTATWLLGLPELDFDDGSGASYRVETPDVLGVAGGSQIELRYTTGGVAAIRYDGAGSLFLPACV